MLRLLGKIFSIKKIQMIISGKQKLTDRILQQMSELCIPVGHVGSVLRKGL